MDRVAVTMPPRAHAGAAQEAPDIGHREGQDVSLVRPSSCIVNRGIPSSRRYLPTFSSLNAALHVVDLFLNFILMHCGDWEPLVYPCVSPKPLWQVESKASTRGSRSSSRIYSKHIKNFITESC